MTDSLISALILAAAIGVPLLAIARLMWRNQAMACRAEQHRRYEAFNMLVARIESKNVGPASKIGAVRQLREFPEYRDLIVVMCNSIEVQGSGPGAEIFQNELKLTEEHLLNADQ